MSAAKSMRGDAFEAFIGAMYLDKGYTFSKKVIINRIINIHIDIDSLEQTETNFKSRLIEWAQKEKKEVDFRLIAEKGEKNNRQYEVEIYVDGEAIGNAMDFSIKGAEKIAAEKACKRLDLD
jgi:ribonuclease-3